MGYWDTKVLPKIKKVFDTKAAAKKTAAAEASKSFDDSKEKINMEFEEKKTDLQPKVVEIYETASPKIKTLIKDPKEVGLKKNSTDVQKFLDELVKIEFPGSKLASETFSKFGASYASGPVLFVFEKVSTYIVTEEKPVQPAAAPAEEPAATTTGKEIVVEAVKEETSTAVATEEPSTTTTTTTTTETVVEKTPEPEVAALAPASTTEPTKATH